MGSSHQQEVGPSLKARAILVDMEEGPVSETFRGPLGDIFDSRHVSTRYHLYLLHVHVLSLLNIE